MFKCIECSGVHTEGRGFVFKPQSKKKKGIRNIIMMFNKINGNSNNTYL